MMKRTLTAKRLFFFWIMLAFLLAWGTAPAPTPAHAAEGDAIRVAVASNFIAPMKDLAKRFEAATGVRVIVSAGSTGKLYAQIKNDAPFDVFLAANAREPERLEAEGAGVVGTRFTYAQGRLALWCSAAHTEVEARACLDDQGGRLAIANPRLAPYGQAAQSTLQALGIDGAFVGRIVTGENIAQAFQLVWSGNVPAGFVALSQVKTRDELKGAYWVVPAAMHAPINQQAVLLSRAGDNENAIAFLKYLRGDAARRVVQDLGYSAASHLAEAN